MAVVVRELGVGAVDGEVRQVMVQWNFTDCADGQRDQYDVDHQHGAEHNLPQNTTTAC